MSKWIECDVDASTGNPYLWKCDECGEEVETKWNYCPECGDPKTSKGKSINTLVKALEAEHKKLREMQSATDKNVGTTDARQDFMDIVYSELESDTDNNRANRIIWAADGYAERRVDDALQVIEELQSAQLGTNLAEVDTDTISRQAALDIFDDYNVAVENGQIEAYSRDRKRLCDLPPAQPEPHYDEWCTDCKEYDKERHCCPRWIKVIRQALADAQPKQRTGKWIPSDSQCGIRCSVCGAPVDDFCHSIDYIDLVYEPNFCPNCVAKMTEGDAE